MDYVEYLGYQYRMIEFDSDEAFDDFFTGSSHALVYIPYDVLQVIAQHSWSW